jgi:hypothetical protein
MPKFETISIEQAKSAGLAAKRDRRRKAMKKPEMVIDSAPDDDFITIRCSSCDDFRVRVEGNTLSQKVIARGIFDLHFKLHHMREDASQAAARIVREATEGR